MLTKPEKCRNCPLYSIGEGFVPPTLKPGSTLLVGEAPGADEAEKGEAFVGPSGSLLNNLLSKTGQDRSSISTANVICCRPPNNIFPLDFKWNHTTRYEAYTAVEYCKAHYLQAALADRDWDKIYAIGDQSLTALTGKKGILIWRGSPLPLKGQDKTKVIPTLHPSYLMRDFKMMPAVINDLKKRPEVPPEYYNLFPTLQDLESYDAKSFAFDFEWDYDGNITICGLSDKFYHAIVSEWDRFIPQYKRIFEASTDLIGHNIIGADTKYFEKFGWNISAKLHDTMLKQHLVQPDMKHGLNFVASVYTNKVFWKGRGKDTEDEFGNQIDTKTQWKTWDQSEALPRRLGGYGGCSSGEEAYRLYNARDTDASYQINTHLDHALKQWRLESTYWNVSLPMAFICRDIADAGIKIDTNKLKLYREELGTQIEALEKTLPEGLRPIEKPINVLVEAPPNTYKPKVLKCKGSKKDKNAHDPIEITIHSPGQIVQCPGCGQDKTTSKLTPVKKFKVKSTKIIRPWNSSQQVMAYARKNKLTIPIDRKRGTEAADVNARKKWGKTNPEFRILDKLKDLSTERNTFAKQEMESVDRLYFELLVHGTSEGRLACRGRRDGIDPNIQNQPKSIRKIYVPDNEDSAFIELDYASAENMLTAFLAKDWSRLEKLKQPGYSEHLELAKALFNIPNLVKGSTEPCVVRWNEGKIVHEVTTTQDKLYDTAKVINHGKNYGMTHIKLKEELDMNEFFYSERKCKEFIEISKELYPETSRWQDETIARATRDRFLRNPFGRIRWFMTRDVATKSLAFLPASTLADIILRAMIAHYPGRFASQLQELGLSIMGELEPGYKISAQIHDSLLIQGPAALQATQALRSRAIMCQPWNELDGFALDVDIKAGAPGASWGELKKLNV